MLAADQPWPQSPDQEAQIRPPSVLVRASSRCSGNHQVYPNSPEQGDEPQQPRQNPSHHSITYKCVPFLLGLFSPCINFVIKGCRIASYMLKPHSVKTICTQRYSIYEAQFTLPVICCAYTCNMIYQVVGMYIHGYTFIHFIQYILAFITTDYLSWSLNTVTLEVLKQLPNKFKNFYLDITSTSNIAVP